MRDNDIDIEPDELGDDLRRAFGASLPPAILDRDGLTLDPTEFAQSLNKGGGPLGLGRRRGPAKQSNGRQLHLLRTRRERPRGRRAAEQRDELAAAAHSITSSASASRV